MAETMEVTTPLRDNVKLNLRDSQRWNTEMFELARYDCDTDVLVKHCLDHTLPTASNVWEFLAHDFPVNGGRLTADIGGYFREWENQCNSEIRRVAEHNEKYLNALKFFHAFRCYESVISDLIPVLNNDSGLHTDSCNVGMFSVLFDRARGERHNMVIISGLFVASGSSVDVKEQFSEAMKIVSQYTSDFSLLSVDKDFIEEMWPHNVDLVEAVSQPFVRKLSEIFEMED